MPRLGLSRNLLKEYTAKVAKNLTQVRIEACGGGTIDHAVIPGQRQWQHKARYKLFAVPNRFLCALANTQDGYFRRVDDGREIFAANTAQA